ncbi:MAG: hypothetical protein IKI32_01690 [Lachnospiraceae bacterium]|nr:hypothetical protein [Parasporobacterium sp.]MBR3516503.1 hypothetical protein [Lachnospiraceae bacterium]MBR7075613.1 hypothetical protein [Lachnospiraceae bacterium]
MDESTEELKANMEKAFAQRVEADRELTALAEHLNGGKGTYATAEDYAYRAGNVLSGVFRDNIKAETLENGVFTKEFVEGTIIPLLKDDHRIVSSMAAVAQENVNTAAGAHIQAQKTDFNQDRADGFAKKMDGKTMEEAGWMLGSPVSNFSQSVVDETMQKNGEVLAKAGKAATIKREAEAKCCDWCLSKAGSYDATNREAYQRHRECRCVIEMHLGGSIKHQTDWKHNAWEERKARIQEKVEEKEAQLLDRRNLNAVKMDGQAVAAAAVPSKMRQYVPDPETRRKIIQEGINEEKAIFAERGTLLSRVAYNLPEKDGYYTVVCHGKPYYVEFKGKKIDPDTLCAIIAQRKDYKKGTDIRLISCYAGTKEDGVARYVADKLGVNVLAADKKAIISKALSGGWDVYSGSKEGKHDGDMLIFEPNGGVRNAESN